MEFLRHQADGCPCRAVVSHGVVSIGENGSRSGLDYAADDANQCGLARIIGSEQSKYLAAVYLQIDFYERLETAGIRLVYVMHKDNGAKFSLAMVADADIVFMDEVIG